MYLSEIIDISAIRVSLETSKQSDLGTHNKNWIITARKRILQRLCFQWCLSVHTMGLPHCMPTHNHP